MVTCHAGFNSVQAPPVCTSIITLLEVVLAQVVERWHSVWAGWVRILGRTLPFFKLRIAVNLFSLGVGFFLITCNRMVQTIPSSFLFPIITYHCENDQFQANNVPRKRKNKSKKRPGKAKENQ